jgi:hypothetical protein
MTVSPHRALLPIAAAALLFAGHAHAVCETGLGEADIYAEYCDETLTYAGCCFGSQVFWCEQEMGTSYTCRLDCAAHGYLDCGWNDSEDYYFCGNSTGSDPDGVYPQTCPDSDGDGFHTGTDCDDEEEAAYPGAVTACDGILDNNCDHEPDSNEVDDDGDLYSECDGDCNDTDTDFNPSAEDICGDGIDHDCDGDFDGEEDNDGDGIPECDGDCDDTDSGVYPDATEHCTDGTDNDCDGDVDGDDTDCGAPPGDDDDDDDGLVTSRGGPYGLSCSLDADTGAAAALTLLLIITAIIIRRR